MIYEVTSQVISLLKQSVWSKVHYNLSENQSTWNITVGKFKLFCFLNDINCQYLQHLKVLRSKYIFGAMRNVFIRYINPTPVQVGHIPPPCRKMAITPKNNDPREPKLYNFSYISMTLPYPFGGSKWQNKGLLKHFCFDWLHSCQPFVHCARVLKLNENCLTNLQVSQVTDTTKDL